MYRKKRKLISLILLVAMLMSLMACKKGETEKIELVNRKFTPGIYTGKAKGISEDLTLEVEVDDSNILSIKILEHNETPNIADLAMEEIPKEILEYQILNVDIITGATVTSTAIIEAVKDALVKADADIDSLMKEIEKEKKDKNIVEKETDIIIIGGGGSGLAAGVSALENNASIIVLEKMPSLGGSTIMAGGQYNAVDDKRQHSKEMRPELIEQIESYTKEEPVNEIHKELIDKLKKQVDEYKSNGSTYLFDSPELHALQAFKGGDNKANLKLVKTLTKGAEESIDWLESLGVEIKDEVATVTGALWPRTHQFTKPLTIGPIDAYVEYIEKNKDRAEIMMQTRADEIIVENDMVVGVKASDKDNEYIIRAKKGVIIATGGFARNQELITKYNKHWDNIDNLNSTNSVSATGDGILMAEKIGANLVGMDYIQLLPVGHPETGGMAGNISINAANQLFINKDGRRFVAEDERRDVLTQGLLEQVDQIMWILHDAHEYYDETVKNDFNEEIGKLVESGVAVKGNTIEELAKKMGVDPKNLVDTVENYNKAVRGEIKDQEGKNLLQDEFNKAPYYASVRVPTIHHTMGGIEINEFTQVLNNKGDIIKGLYAAGEVTGGIHGANRLGGNAIPDTVVFGKIAGRSAAEEK